MAIAAGENVYQLMSMFCWMAARPAIHFTKDVNGGSSPPP